MRGCCWVLGCSGLFLGRGGLGREGVVKGSAECALCAQSGTLKAALLDYTKRCRPGDSEKHNMIALCFSMCREIGQNHEAAACTQLKLIESRPWGEWGWGGTGRGLSLPGGGSCPEQFPGALRGETFRALCDGAFPGADTARFPSAHRGCAGVL